MNIQIFKRYKNKKVPKGTFNSLNKEKIFEICKKFFLLENFAQVI